MNIKRFIIWLLITALCLTWIPLFFMMWDATAEIINDELIGYSDANIITPQQAEETMFRMGAGFIALKWLMVWPIVLSVLVNYLSIRLLNHKNKKG